MTKALSDDWMRERGFVDGDVVRPVKIEAWWAHKHVHDVPMATPLTITSKVTCKDAIALLKKEGFDMVPVLGSAGNVIGVVTEGNMTSKIISGAVKPEQTVEDARVIYKTFKKFGMQACLAEVAMALDLEPFVLVVTGQRCYDGSQSVNGGAGDKSHRCLGKISNKEVISGIITRIDLLDYVSKGND